MVKIKIQIPESEIRWCGAILLGLMACIAAEKTSAADSWPQFRGNPQLTGVAGTSLAEQPRVLWEFKSGENFGSSPAIVGGVVYVGCDDGHLYAIDLADGKLKWKSEPARFAGSTTSQPLAAAIQSSPAVHQEMVMYGDEDGTFHALGRKSGSELWKFKTDAEIISSPNPVGDQVLFGSYDGHLYCLSIGDGSLRWKVKTEGRVHGTPGIMDDKVVIAGCDERLRILRLKDGGQVGEVSMGSVSGASAAILRGEVHVGTFGNQVLCIDLAASRLKWTFNAAKDFPFYASAAVTDDLIIIGGRDKVVHGIERKSGKEKWSFKTRSRVDSSAVIVGNRAFVGSSDGNLYAIRLSDGEETWRFETGSAITASPAAASGRLVVGTEDGILYCFGEKSGPAGRGL